MTDRILYTSDDGKAQVQLRTNRGTVWLSQRQMADLFDVSPDNISLHLKNIYDDGELHGIMIAPNFTCNCLPPHGIQRAEPFEPHLIQILR